MLKKMIILIGVVVLSMLSLNSKDVNAFTGTPDDFSLSERIPSQEILPKAMAPEGYGEVTVDEAYDLLQSGNSLFLDVRRPEEYEIAHIEGAVNLPLNMIEDLVHNLDKSKPIIVYCKTGRRAAEAAGILAGYGFEVYNILGSIFEWGQRYDTTPHQYSGEIRPITMWWKKDQVYPLKMGFYSHTTGAEGEIDMPYIGGEQPSSCPFDSFAMSFASFVALKVQVVAEDLNIELENVMIEVTEGLTLKDGMVGLPLYVTYEIESDGCADLIIEELRERIDFEKMLKVPPVWSSEKLGGIMSARAILTGDNRVTTVAGGGAVEYYAFDTQGIIDPRDALMASAMACVSILNVMFCPLFGVDIVDYKTEYTAFWETLDGVTWWDTLKNKMYATIGKGQTEMYNDVLHFSSKLCPVGNSFGFISNPASQACGAGENEITEVHNPVVPGLTDARLLKAVHSMAYGLRKSLPSLLVLLSDLPSSIPNLVGDLLWEDIGDLREVLGSAMPPMERMQYRDIIGNLSQALMIMGGNKLERDGGTWGRRNWEQRDVFHNLKLIHPIKK